MKVHLVVKFAARLSQLRGESGRLGVRYLSSSPSAVVPWPLQPVINLEEQGELEAAAEDSSVETRTRSVQLLLEKKKNFFLCKFLLLISS